jgi:hypothetical protein
MEMAYRSQTTAVLLLTLAFGLGWNATAWGQTLQLEVRHKRLGKDRPGVVTFDAQGVEFRQSPARKQAREGGKEKAEPKLESRRWAYEDIQQLWLSPEKLVIVTYQDRAWLLGADRQFEFVITDQSRSVAAIYEFLRNKLDQRFVAALADPNVEDEWTLPVKRLGVLRGSEGRLHVGRDRIVYLTNRKEQSRTWRFQDIENVSSSGPFQLTLTTYERSKSHYAGRKDFNFQLKQRLDENRFDRLWKRIQQDKGLKFLTTIQERSSETR